MVHKVVYNNCYGGYGYSDEAVKWLEQNGSKYMKDFIAESRKRIETNKQAKEHIDLYAETVEHHIAYDIAYKFPRHNLDLVKCVEKLGSAASGTFSERSVYKLKGRMYRIEEYDGAEIVMEPDDYEYTIIDEDER